MVMLVRQINAERESELHCQPGYCDRQTAQVSHLFSLAQFVFAPMKPISNLIGEPESVIFLLFCWIKLAVRPINSI
jgi:hypothetical protein